MFFDYSDVNSNARLCLLKSYAIFEKKINEALGFLGKQVF